MNAPGGSQLQMIWAIPAPKLHRGRLMNPLRLLIHQSASSSIIHRYVPSWQRRPHLYPILPLIRRFATGGTSESVQDPSTPKDRATGTHPKYKRLLQNIRTLDPPKLTGDDHIDFSIKKQPILRIILHPCGSADSPAPRLSRRTQFSAYSWSSHRFPPGTHGFLYYHVPRNGSPLAGELRFRLTSSRNPTSFETGADLLTDRGIPWRYPLYKTVCRSGYQGIISLLLQDGLVSQRTLDLVTAAVSPLRRTATNAALSALDARHPTRMAATPVLSAFGQEFDLRYTADLNFCGVFASQDAFLTHHMRCVTTFKVPVQGKYVHYSPFRGSVVCCFERSTLLEHTGRRVVVIRIKRFIDSDPILDVPAPVNLNVGRKLQVEELRPREGELLKATGHQGSVKPWAVDVDKVCKGGRTGATVPWKVLRVLFENEALYGSPPQSEASG